MKKAIQYFKSPTFEKEKRQIIIMEPEIITAKTPVLFFFDGQILKLGLPEFDQVDGIEILNVWKKVKNFIIIAVNSMNYDHKNKYQKRVQELLNQDENGNYLFYEIVKSKIQKLKAKYPGKWIGFGYSLSGFLVGYHQQLFDKSVLVSPGFRNHSFLLPKDTFIFYGKKEYRFFSNKKINKPIKRIAKLNPRAKVMMLKKMKHTFSSWNEYFPTILKTILWKYIKIKTMDLQLLA